MNSFEAYTAFVALKRHFTPGSSYDYHKYRGKVSASFRNFEGRSDAFYFEKLARKRDVVSFLVANLSDNPKLWVGDFFVEAAELRYERWCRVTESLTYVLKSELAKLDPDFNSNFVFVDGQHPVALRAMMAGEVSPEVLCVVDQLVGFTRHWDANSWDPTVKQAVHRIRRLAGFVEFDRASMSTTLKKLFSNDAN